MALNQHTPQWTTADLRAALADVEAGVPKSHAAKKYNIPWGTFCDKISGRRSLLAVPRTYLSNGDEEEIATYILKSAERGFGRTKEELLIAVKHMLDFRKRTTKSKDNMPTDKWFKRFKRDHPEITFRKPLPLGKERAKVTAAIINA